MTVLVDGGLMVGCMSCVFVEGYNLIYTPTTSNCVNYNCLSSLDMFGLYNTQVLTGFTCRCS